MEMMWLNFYEFNLEWNQNGMEVSYARTNKHHIMLLYKAIIVIFLFPITARINF